MLRTRILLGIALLVAFLCGAIAQSQQYPQPQIESSKFGKDNRRAQPAPTVTFPTSQEITDAITGGIERADEKRETNRRAPPPDSSGWWFNCFLVIFTGLLVVVGGVNCYLIFWTLKATETAADAAKSSADSLVIIERPYIFVTTPRIVAGGHELYYALTNFGRTPAILRFYTCQTYINNQPQQLMDNTIWNGWEVLRNGESHQGKLFEIRQKLEVDKAPFFWIEVFYFDMFNYMHTSGFTFYFSGKGEFVAIASEKYNYHRTEKMAKGEWHPKIGTPPTD